MNAHFCTETHLVSNVQLVKQLLLLNEWVIEHCFGRNHNTLAMAVPIDYVDGVCHMNKLKSSRTCLTNYLGFTLCKQFLIARDRHTCTHTHAHTNTHTY